MDITSLTVAGLTDDRAIVRIKKELQNEAGKNRRVENADKSESINNRADFKNVAKEMESLFAYELLKVMRQTADSMSAEKKGQGYNIYMSLFDMEISKLFADKGLGLQDAIVSWLERRENMTEEIDNSKNDDFLQKIYD